MRFLAAVLAVALLFGAVGVVNGAAPQADRTMITAQTGSADCSVDVDTDVFDASLPLVGIVASRERGVMAVARATSIRLVALSFALPLRL